MNETARWMLIQQDLKATGQRIMNQAKAPERKYMTAYGATKILRRAAVRKNQTIKEVLLNQLTSYIAIQKDEYATFFLVSLRDRIDSSDAITDVPSHWFRELMEQYDPYVYKDTGEINFSPITGGKNT